jgi:hypothetical protein
VIIQTTKGPIDESELVAVPVDTERFCGFEWRLKASGEVVGHIVDAWKYDRLTEVTALADDGFSHCIRKLADLDMSTGCVDNANEYTWWIEYRLKGTDKIVSRQAATHLKRPGVEAKSEAGGF